MLITKTNELITACARMAQSPYITVDTEFMRETTYWPKLCLIQMADSDGPILVDALADGLDLTPFFELMADERILKVFHAARQDIEIVWQRSGNVPKPLFDTQVAAMVLGYGDSVAYDQLVHSITGSHIDKSSRFTDWSRRPLSKEQMAYAAADVTHLRPVYEKLAENLQKRARTDWVDEEMAVLSSPDTYRQDPGDAWKRLKTRVKKPRELAILMEVAAYRESEAQRRDVPRARVLKDEAVSEIAQRAPETPEALGQLRTIPNGFERSRTGSDILSAVKLGLSRDPRELPKLERPRSVANNGATVELLRVLLKQVSEKNGVAPKVIATTDDLDAIALDDSARVPALSGWRRELFGEAALKLKRGELALALQEGRVIVVECVSEPLRKARTPAGNIV